MKPSGLPWIEEIPEHWATSRIRDIAELRVSNVDKHVRQGEAEVRLCNYVDVFRNERILESAPYMRSSASAAEIERFGIRTGDVLITKDSESWDEIAVPAYVENEAPDLVCGYHLAILRPKPGVSGRFLHRAIEETRVAAQFHVRAHGVTRYGLSQGAIKDVAVPVPTLEEQEAISSFLDLVGSRINWAISAKRKTIGLLNEQKQAIVHRAVTRGLDSSVPLKPSTLPRLADIPEHWEVRRLRSIVRSPIRNGLGVSAQPFRGDWPRYIRITDIEDARRLREDAKASLPPQIAGDALLEEGDILLAAVGATYGKSYLYSAGKQSACYAGYLVRVSLAGEVRPEYLSYWTQSAAYWNQVRAAVIKTTVENFSATRYKSLSLPVPPVDEQHSIIEYLDEISGQYEGLIAKLERELELLAEYRIRLTSDVVTGKLDVREGADQLSLLERESIHSSVKPMEESMDRTGPARIP